MASPILDSDDLSTIELQKGVSSFSRTLPEYVSERTKHRTSRSSSFHVHADRPLSRTWRHYRIAAKPRSIRCAYAPGGVKGRHEPIDDPTPTAAGVGAIPEVRPYVVDRPVFPIEALPAGVNAAVPEETVKRALVFATGEL